MAGGGGARHHGAWRRGRADDGHVCGGGIFVAAREIWGDVAAADRDVWGAGDQQPAEASVSAAAARAGGASFGGLYDELSERTFDVVGGRLPDAGDAAGKRGEGTASEVLPAGVGDGGDVFDWG